MEVRLAGDRQLRSGLRRGGLPRRLHQDPVLPRLCGGAVRTESSFSIPLFITDRCNEFNLRLTLPRPERIPLGAQTAPTEPADELPGSVFTSEYTALGDDF